MAENAHIDQKIASLEKELNQLWVGWKLLFFVLLASLLMFDLGMQLAVPKYVVMLDDLLAGVPLLWISQFTIRHWFANHRMA